jgi:NAD(P)H-dependent FMN reductase
MENSLSSDKKIKDVMNIAIILSSVRDNRLADSVYEKVRSLIGDRFEVTLVDPKVYQLPLLNKRFFEMENPEKVFQELHTIFENADGFILITAEYNHTIPPALTNMLDHFLKEFNQKSCGIVGYSNGALGGGRCIEQLRLMTAALGMPAISPAPTWGFANKADLPEGQGAAKAFEKSFMNFLDQFEWYTEAYADMRKKKQSGPKLN